MDGERTHRAEVFEKLGFTQKDLDDRVITTAEINLRLIDRIEALEEKLKQK